MMTGAPALRRGAGGGGRGSTAAPCRSTRCRPARRCARCWRRWKPGSARASSRRPAATRCAAHGTLLPAAGLYPAIPALRLPRHLRPGAAGGHTAVDPPAVQGDYTVLLPAGRRRRQCDRRRPHPGDRGAEGHLYRLEPPRRGLRRGRALLQYRAASCPSPRRRAERLAANDPRPSLEERYAGPAAYVAAVRAAATRLVAERLLLPEDATAIAAAEAAARRGAECGVARLRMP